MPFNPLIFTGFLLPGFTICFAVAIVRLAGKAIVASMTRTNAPMKTADAVIGHIVICLFVYAHFAHL